MGYKSPNMYTIPIAFGTTTMIANASYYFGSIVKAASNGEGARIATVLKSGTIKSLTLLFSTTGNPTTENLVTVIRLNGGVGCDVGTFNFAGGVPTLTISNYTLNLSVTVGDTLEVKITTANPFVTSPVGIIGGYMLIECE